jgi:outer membrane protein OmpA-like peptidoglycan-associated protein
MKTTTRLSLLSLALLAGCATVEPSRELMSARALYQQARGGEANVLEPAKVLEAKQALDRAELAHDEEPGSEHERHYAYIAQRRALLAIARSDSSAARADGEEAKRELVAQTDAQRKAAREALRREQRQLQQIGSAIDEEARTRSQAERELDATLASLKDIALVKAEQERTVITLSGSVLFEMGETKLMPIAKERLTAVADYLRRLEPGKTIRVVGHTDSSGTDDVNKALSLHRARAVRDYLVSLGVPADRVTAVGMGESTPVAPNDSAENRANNRRVEIIIEPLNAAESAG